MKMKYAFNLKHKAVFFKEGDIVYLRLQKVYSIPAEPNQKLGRQRARSFKVIERIGKLVYKLEVSGHWRVHNVISVAHLEPAAPGEDPYSRDLNTQMQSS